MVVALALFVAVGCSANSDEPAPAVAKEPAAIEDIQPKSPEGDSAPVAAAERAEAREDAAQDPGREEPAEWTDPAAIVPFIDRERLRRSRDVSVSVRSVLGDELVQGWPLAVEVAVLSPAAVVDDATPLLIGADGEPWAKAVRLEVRREAANANWPLELLPVKAEKIRLDADGGGFLTWIVPPEQTRDLEPGDYEIVAILDTTSARGSDGWKGKSLSVPINIRVRKESGSDVVGRHFAFAQYWLLRGDNAHAAGEIDALLERSPKHQTALLLKADLLTAEEKHAAAYDVLTQGVDEYQKAHPDADEPPSELLLRQRELLPKLLVPADSAEATAAPAAPVPATAPTLKFEDIAKLLDVGIDEAAILKRLERNRAPLELNDQQRRQLEKAGASKKLLEALTPKTKPLKFDDILKLLELGIDEAAILKRAEKNRTPLDLNANQRQQLERAGASQKLLDALTVETVPGER